MGNGYCDGLGIAVPSNTFIVSLLEHGHPMTLEEVAYEVQVARLEATVI